MGRAASHITLECAFQTQPNICLISEEVEAKGTSLEQIVDQICASIIKRTENGDNFGIVLIPEGLIEFIPEIKRLIEELNDVIAAEEKAFLNISNFIDQMYWLSSRVKESSYRIMQSLPPEIAREFLMDRDPHGNVQVSRIETEKLLVGMVEKRLASMKEKNLYNGKFTSQTHFFGYEGRCAFPTNFDADYCYSLGFSAFVLIAAGLTGYLSSVKNLTAPAGEWTAGGVPLTMMMNLEHRHGSQKPVIKKALVELDGKPFKTFAANRNLWAEKTCFLFPGAIQYYGPQEVCDQPPFTLKLEHEK
jgi:pyrophosphate--fructose-6-phosphate 1-phosphotransferase